MNNLKWFSGGNERSKEAITCLKLLQKNLNDTTERPLKKILINYLSELENQSGSVPTILSRFNLEVSHCLLNNSIELSKEDKQLIKEISSLSQIRYGY